MAGKSWDCALCDEKVHELGAYVKISTSKFAHFACVEAASFSRGQEEQKSHGEQEIAALRAEVARAQEEARAAKPEAKRATPAAAPPKERPYMTKPEWDAEVEKLIAKHIVHYGPVEKPNALRNFLWSIYRYFVEAGLVVQVIEERAPESGKLPTLDEYLKGG